MWLKPGDSLFNTILYFELQKPPRLIPCKGVCSLKPLFINVAFNLPLDSLFTYAIPQEQDIQPGMRLELPFGKRKLIGFSIEFCDKPRGDFEIKEVIRSIDEMPIFGEREIELAKWVADLYICTLGEALSAMLPGAKKERLIDEEEVGLDGALKHDFPLAEQQKKAIAILSRPESAGQFFYLHGVTGSGKTEVFLRTAEILLKRGKGIIYLVPEISLTHQVFEDFQHLFGSQLAVIHSGLTPSQKLNQWNRISSGQSRCVIGARSAIFAPVPDLGMIVIDEEHDGSYKSQNTPRYHARQVAMYRARREKALLVMGSATPSLEAYYQMKIGRVTEIAMAERLSGGKMPEIKVINMRKEKSQFGADLTAEMYRSIKAKRQCILFLNRRGFAYTFHCRSCGYELQCRHCSVSLTFHKAKAAMVCHYCGFQQQQPSSCPECGSLDLGYFGFGTEKVEEELARIYPDLRMARVDTDSVRKKGALRERLKQFKNHELDVLLGTQMVAKGLNFPKVNLVGILNADMGLQIPDFRAAERTFALIVQVSGRAGRVIPDGKVIVQSFKPENPAIALAAQGRWEEFYQMELEIRKELEFPPFSRLFRLVFRGTKEAEVHAAAQVFGDRLERELGDLADILGPTECPLYRIARNFRVHILIKTKAFNESHKILSSLVRSFTMPAHLYLETDIDPLYLI